MRSTFSFKLLGTSCCAGVGPLLLSKSDLPNLPRARQDRGEGGEQRDREMRRNGDRKGEGEERKEGRREGEKGREGEGGEERKGEGKEGREEVKEERRRKSVFRVSCPQTWY